MLEYLYGKSVARKLPETIRSCHINTRTFSNLVMFHTYPPMEMEQIEYSETSAYKIQTPENYPEERIQQTANYKVDICYRVGLYKDMRNFFIVSSRGNESLIHVRMTRGYKVVSINTSGYLWLIPIII